MSDSLSADPKAGFPGASEPKPYTRRELSSFFVWLCVDGPKELRGVDSRVLLEALDKWTEPG